MYVHDGHFSQLILAPLHFLMVNELFVKALIIVLFYHGSGKQTISADNSLLSISVSVLGMAVRNWKDPSTDELTW